MDIIKKKYNKRARRAHRTRAKIRGTSERPRLTVHRSLQHISVQIIDDTTSKTLAAIHDRSLTGGKSMKGVERAHAVGIAIADKAKSLGITKVVFDRGSYRYHGQVKLVADGAREGGLKF